MLRGNNRGNIFYDYVEYHTFLKILADAAEAYSFKVHLYCLMTNHAHLVIEVGEIPISRIMQSLTSRYARFHNKKNNKIGHVFQGRFKSKLISSDDYLLELCYYIHMNPIKANMVHSLDAYSWSSHGSYQSGKPPGWLVINFIVSLINKRYKHPVGYRIFIDAYDRDNITSSCSFDENGSLIINDEVSRMQNQPFLYIKNISLFSIIRLVCEHLKIPQEKISSDSVHRRVCLARSIITYYAHYHAQYTFADVAPLLGRHPDSITKTLRRHLKLAKESREIMRMTSSIEKWLSLSDKDKRCK